MTVIHNLMFKDKSIAIVGNAEVELDPDLINSKDIVILMNKGIKTWKDLRCDVYCYSGVNWYEGNNPVYHMTPKGREVAGDVFFYNEDHWEILQNRLGCGCRPTTGLMVIDMVTRERTYSVDLYAFDFFSTGVAAAVHCPEREKELVKEWNLFI